MRDWTKLLLALCVVALGAGMFLLERRISGLEAELRAAQSSVASETTLSQPVRIAMSDNESQHRLELEQKVREFAERQGIVVQPPQAAPRTLRQPSGVINGIPYYFVPLSK